ncbi:hypothetical protein E4U33_001511, partial [Claviceps sp. LM78 group G4]
TKTRSWQSRRSRRPWRSRSPRRRNCSWWRRSGVTRWLRRAQTPRDESRTPATGARKNRAGGFGADCEDVCEWVCFADSCDAGVFGDRAGRL